MSALLSAILFSEPRDGTWALMRPCGCAAMREEEMWHWRFSHKIGNIRSLFLCCLASSGLTAETQEQFTHGSESHLTPCPVTPLRHHCEFSDHIIMITLLVAFCLESWNLLPHFNLLFPPVHDCALLFWKVWGNQSSIALLFLSSFMVRKEYTRNARLRVGGSN